MSPHITTPSYTSVDVCTSTNTNENYLHHDTTQITSSIFSDILLRLSFITVVGILSVWANLEASKGFEIYVENLAPTGSLAGYRFQLMYVSNDRATRLILSASKHVKSILYPDYTSSIGLSSSNKQVKLKRVTLRLAARNLTHMVTVDSFKEHEFVISLSPSLLEIETSFESHAMFIRAVQQGMAWVWLHDSNAPKTLVNGMVEYISGLAGVGAVGGFSGDSVLAESGESCWMDEDPVAVAHFLSYCEEKRKGFIQRLNLAIRDRWDDRTVDDALGISAQHLCWSHVSG